MLEKKTQVLDTNLQKQLLSDFEQRSKIKSQEYSKFITDKKALITIIYGHYNKAIQTKIVLRRTFDVGCQAGNMKDSSNKYVHFALEATTEDSFSGLTNKLYQ